MISIGGNTIMIFSSLNKTAAFIGLALLVLALTACAGPPAVQTDPLAGSSWVLDQVLGEEAIPGTQVTIQFNEGRVEGSAGCNSYGGGYSLGGDNSLTTGEIVRTLMACENPPGVMDQEDAYLQALQNAASYRIDGQRLEILDASGATVLWFSRS
jgi:heat shock protein HslJ